MNYFIKKYNFILIIVLSIIIFPIFFTACTNQKENRIYVGTNDKDTNKIEIPLEKQKEIILSIILKYTNGVSIFEANGYWKNAKEEITIEKTFVCDFLNTNIKTIEKICAEILVELNQESILYV